jgi:secreted trypsin-like serine protease
MAKMRKTIVATCMSVLLLVVVLPAGAITFGQLDEGRHPYVGALVAEFGDPAALGPFCTGTLISPTVFLTAAHCIQAIDAFDIDPWWVTFSSPADSTATLLTGTAHVPPGANAGGFNDPLDLAIVVLEASVTGVTPAQLPGAGLLKKKSLKEATLTPVGYGTTRDTQQGGFQAINDNVDRRFATQSFLSLQKAWLLLNMNPATGSGGTCYGDSGGPHFLGGPTSNLIVSITVTGDAVCKATDKTYRLDTAAARAFLDDFVSLPS